MRPVRTPESIIKYRHHRAGNAPNIEVTRVDQGLMCATWSDSLNARCSPSSQAQTNAYSSMALGKVRRNVIGKGVSALKKIAIARLSDLENRSPAYALVAGVDLVIIRLEDKVSVLYGRCLHRGALLSDGCIKGENLICGLHGWDYRVDTGVSEYHNSEKLAKFNAWLEDDQVLVDEDEVAAWALDHPQPYKRDTYQGTYQDFTGTRDEPHVGFIRQLAGEGLFRLGLKQEPGKIGTSRQRRSKEKDVHCEYVVLLIR